MKLVGIVLLLAGAVRGQGVEFPKAQPAPDLALGKSYTGTSKSKRPFWYRLPGKIDDDRPPDLILLLHGTGLSYKWGFFNYGVHQGHFRKDDIVVSPESEAPGRGFVQAKPDREEIEGLIKSFRKTFPIRNVYLYGHSQGAFFCYYFAGERPALIDGIVAHAGNFFKAKTAKAAREKVAIGILHGRADAVVTVECAYATDHVYRKAGYTKVRLWAVEGLNERTGHWPLPFHVQRMLAWCDLVSMKTSADGVALMKRELARDQPDLAMAAQAAVRARALGAEGTEGVVAAAEANAAALVKADVSKHGPWCAHLQLACAAFDGLPEWHAALKPLRALIKKHSKQVEQGMKAVRKGTKRSFADGLKVLEIAYAGRGYAHLADHLRHRSLEPGDLVTEKDQERYAAMQAARKAADAQGRKDFAALTAPALEQR